MYTLDAYQAMYQYIGLSTLQGIVAFLTSTSIIKASLVMIFGTTFLFYLIGYFSNFMSFGFLNQRGVSVSRIFRLIVSFYIGLSILSVQKGAHIQNYGGTSYENNKYIQANLTNDVSNIKVPWLFDLTTRVAEEIGYLFNHTIDKVLKGDRQSNLKAPNFFYKAAMYSTTSTIKGPKIRKSLVNYIEACAGPALANSGKNDIDDYFSASKTPELLRSIVVNSNTGDTCYDLKRNLMTSVRNETESGRLAKLNSMSSDRGNSYRTGLAVSTKILNTVTSKQLANEYIGKRFLVGGDMASAEATSTLVNLKQMFSTLNSTEGKLALFGGSKYQGFNEAAKRQKAFSEHLKRAPHILGLLKMCLMVIFPFLVFFIIAGKWKPFVWWFMFYLSLCIWPVFWNLFYYVMVGITESTAEMKKLTELNELSLTSSAILSQSIYYFHQIYSYLQLGVGVAISGAFIPLTRSLMTDTAEDKLDVLGTFQKGKAGTQLAKSGVGAATKIASKVVTKGVV